MRREYDRFLRVDQHGFELVEIRHRPGNIGYQPHAHEEIDIRQPIAQECRTAYVLLGRQPSLAAEGVDEVRAIRPGAKVDSFPFQHHCRLSVAAVERDRSRRGFDRLLHQIRRDVHPALVNDAGPGVPQHTQGFLIQHVNARALENLERRRVDSVNVVRRQHSEIRLRHPLFRLRHSLSSLNNHADSARKYSEFSIRVKPVTASVGGDRSFSARKRPVFPIPPGPGGPQPQLACCPSSADFIC